MVLGIEFQIELGRQRRTAAMPTAALLAKVMNLINEKKFDMAKNMVILAPASRNAVTLHSQSEHRHLFKRKEER